MQVADPFDFLNFCGAIGNGFVPDATLPMFIEKVLEVGETSDSVEKLAKLDQLLPVYQSGETHPLYWICLLWLESMGLVERADCEGGLTDFELTETGHYVIQGLRDRRVGFH